MKKITLLAVGLVLVVIGLGFFLMFRRANVQNTKQDETALPSQQSKIEEGNVTVENGFSENGVRIVSVDALEYAFTPININVKQGETIKLTLNNTGSMEHDLVIDELNVNTGPVGPGSQITVEFKVTESGSYEFYCSISNHRSLGMKGSFNVAATE